MKGDEKMIGQSKHNIDTKGRIIIPNKFRESLGDTFILTQGLDNCISVYPMQEWEIKEKALEALPEAQGRKIRRFFFSNAEEVTTDSQGRIIIPLRLREYAGLKKEVYITGAGNKAEIWSGENWNKLGEELTNSEIEQAMLELGF